MRSVRVTIGALRRNRQQRRLFFWLVTGALLASGLMIALLLGQTGYSLSTLLAVLWGENIPGASFTILELRLPRAVLAVLAGGAFGLGGAAFQLLLRNPLASPDIIGISAGASAAAVFCIVVMGITGPIVSVLAVAAGLGVALLIYLLAWRGEVTGTRLILIGIGISAMLQSLTAYSLSRAPAWSLQEALRWLAGSLNGTSIDQTLPMAVVLLLCWLILLWRLPDLEAMRYGDSTAMALGAKVRLTKVTVILAGVGLVATATAVTGPVSFVAFLAGPIAARLTGRDGSVLLPAFAIGALLVLICDFTGQFLLPSRYPVGIITGILGGPYLVYLILRENRKGAGA